MGTENKMKLTSPKDIRTDVIVDELIAKIEDQFLKLPKDSINEYAATNSLNITVAGEYPTTIRDRVRAMYIQAGWYQILHKCNDTDNGFFTHFTFMEDTPE